jgi:hypothetical protein
MNLGQTPVLLNKVSVATTSERGHQGLVLVGIFIALLLATEFPAKADLK